LFLPNDPPQTAGLALVRTSLKKHGGREAIQKGGNGAHGQVYASATAVALTPELCRDQGAVLPADRFVVDAGASTV
jgi:hypothetical protein